MKMKPCLILVLVFSGLLASFRPALAFDETYSHPYLTKLIVETWNKQSDIKLSPTAIEQIIAGSQAEDMPASRSLNHFYNPLSGAGLTVEGLKVGYPTSEWAVNKNEQAEPLFGGSFTWPEALAAKQAGDEAKAYAALGHILHLLEDMGMPAHTRNDQHVNGDGFEAWCQNANSAEQKLLFDDKNIKPAACSDLSACLQALAVFSNNNFFSDDTINQTEFVEPWADMKLGKDHYYYSGKNLLAFADPAQDKIILNDAVFRDYWRRLAPQILSYGLRVMNLFANPSPVEIKTKSRGQISAGGIKISAEAPEQLYFNRLKLKPKTKAIVAPEISYDPQQFFKNPASRFFPIINVSKTIPPQFFGAAPMVLPSAPLVNQVLQVAGLKIEAPAVQPIVEPPPPPPVSVPPPVVAPPPPPEPPQSPPADLTAPTANFVNLALAYQTDNFTASWSGQDETTASNDLVFDVDYKLKNTDWLSWLSQTGSTTASLGQNLPEETRLDLRVRARDAAGNWSPWQTATTIVFKPDTHNPLLYEKLEHLYHFAECQDKSIADSLSGRFLFQGAAWIDGRWGCGAEQSYPEQESIGARWFQPLGSSDVSLSFFFKDISSPTTSSRNRFILFDYDSSKTSDWALGIIPEIYGTVVYNNGESRKLTAMPKDHDWHNIFLVANGQYVALYIDGELTDQVFGNFSPKNPLTGLSIVGENSPSQFDELAIWSRSLSSTEIMDYYNSREPLKAVK